MLLSFLILHGSFHSDCISLWCLQIVFLSFVRAVIFFIHLLVFFCLLLVYVGLHILASVIHIPLCSFCLSNEMNGDLLWLFCYSCCFHHCVVFFIHLWVIFWSYPCFCMIVIQTCCSVICFMYTIEWVVFCCSF